MASARGNLTYLDLLAAVATDNPSSFSTTSSVSPWLGPPMPMHQRPIPVGAPALGPPMPMHQRPIPVGAPMMGMGTGPLVFAVPPGHPSYGAVPMGHPVGMSVGMLPARVSPMGMPLMGMPEAASMMMPPTATATAMPSTTVTTVPATVVVDVAPTPAQTSAPTAPAPTRRRPTRWGPPVDRGASRSGTTSRRRKRAHLEISHAEETEATEGKAQPESQSESPAYTTPARVAALSAAGASSLVLSPKTRSDISCFGDKYAEQLITLLFGKCSDQTGASATTTATTTAAPTATATPAVQAVAETFKAVAVAPDSTSKNKKRRARNPAKELFQLLWKNCGMTLKKQPVDKIKNARTAFYRTSVKDCAAQNTALTQSMREFVGKGPTPLQYIDFLLSVGSLTDEASVKAQLGKNYVDLVTGAKRDVSRPTNHLFKAQIDASAKNLDPEMSLRLLRRDYADQLEKISMDCMKSMTVLSKEALIKTLQSFLTRLNSEQDLTIYKLLISAEVKNCLTLMPTDPHTLVAIQKISEQHTMKLVNRFGKLISRKFFLSSLVGHLKKLNITAISIAPRKYIRDFSNAIRLIDKRLKSIETCQNSVARLLSMEEEITDAM